MGVPNKSILYESWFFHVEGPLKNTDKVGELSDSLFVFYDRKMGLFGDNG